MTSHGLCPCIARSVIVMGREQGSECTVMVGFHEEQSKRAKKREVWQSKHGIGGQKMATEKRLIYLEDLLRFPIRIDHYDKVNGNEHFVFGVETVLEYAEYLPTVDAVEVVHGRWILTAHEEYVNYRWNVTAECSECHHDKGEVYAGFFTGFKTDVARDIVLEHAESVKLDNYCPNCGAKMDGGNDDV
jgi:hypothetical protein